MERHEHTSKRLTQLGFDKLTAEYYQLLHVERPKVVQGVATAAAEGDRSENAEYIYGKKRLREIDKRLQYLGMLLDGAVAVVPKTGSLEVDFGHSVVVRDDKNHERRYTIVGEGETEFTVNSVSVSSPMAQALLGKRVGDVVTVERPVGDMELEIVNISS